MNRAELPENLNHAADEAVRYVAAQHDTAIISLSELEAVFAGPDKAAEEQVIETPDYANMNDIELMKELNNLNVQYLSDAKLKAHMDATFPAGYKKADALLRLYSFDAYKSEVNKSHQNCTDNKVLEAQNYQIHQLNARRINAAKDVWAENAAATFVDEMNEQVQAFYQRDLEEAYTENDQRLAQARSKVAEQHAAREVESFLEMDEFIAACKQANYSITDITSMKPERAAFAFRSLMNEWLKNGAVEPKDAEVAIVEVPTPMTLIKKAIKSQKQVSNIVVPEAIPEETEVITRPLTAGARAYTELGEPARIEAVNVSALGGKVLERFVINRKQDKR